MSLDARVLWLLVPLVTALDPSTAHAAVRGDFAEPVDIGGGRKMYRVPRLRLTHRRVGIW
jgi:hypothetical protein